MVRRATIRDCLLLGLGQAAPVEEYFGGLLENNVPSYMLGARYCLCPLGNKMFQNILSMNPGGLDGTYFPLPINNECIS